MQYLTDFKLHLTQRMMEGWIGGKLELNLEKEARGRVLTLTELEDPHFWDHLVRFYAPDELERDPRVARPANEIGDEEPTTEDEEEHEDEEDH